MLLALALISFTTLSYIYLESIIRFLFAFMIAYMVISVLLGIYLIIKYFYPVKVNYLQNKSASIKNKIYSFFRIKRKPKVEANNT